VIPEEDEEDLKKVEMQELGRYWWKDLEGVLKAIRWPEEKDELPICKMVTGRLQCFDAKHRTKFLNALAHFGRVEDQYISQLFAPNVAKAVGCSLSVDESYTLGAIFQQEGKLVGILYDPYYYNGIFQYSVEDGPLTVGEVVIDFADHDDGLVQSMDISSDSQDDDNGDLAAVWTVLLIARFRHSCFSGVDKHVVRQICEQILYEEPLDEELLELSESGIKKM
jgi:hypothetical protein